MDNKPLNGDERLDDIFSLEKNKLILLASEDYIIFSFNNLLAGMVI